ncbi:hypothetical protein FGB62_29g225 [Gracilaria domingensis]|nr:hypothetical protein FGB62_29g225 [Gracilaria domingensis]
MNATGQPLSALAMQQPTPVVTKPDTLQYRCQLCNVSCDTMAQFSSHSSGQKHRKKAELFNAFKQAEKRFPSESIGYQQPSSWHCQLCAASMHAQNEVLQHLQCAKHKRLLHAARNTSGRSAAQNMPVTAIKPAAVSAAIAVMQSPVTESPSSTHSPSRQQSSDPAMQSSPTSSNITVRGTITKPFKNNKNAAAYACSVCNVTCTSNDNLNVHLASARHRKKVEGSALNHNIVCNICQITVSGAANYEAHLKGKAHAKKRKQRDADALASSTRFLDAQPSAADMNPSPQPVVSQSNAADPLQALPVPVLNGSAAAADVRPPIALAVRNQIPFRSVPYPELSSREQS